MTPGERVARGERARQIIEESTMKQAFSGVRDAIVRQLESVPIGDDKTPHRLALTLQCLKQLEAHLISFVEDGKLAVLEQQEEAANEAPSVWTRFRRR